MTGSALELAVQLDRAAIGRAVGLTLDPWQVAALRSEDPGLLLVCGRQTGKSTTAGLLVLDEILHRAPALVILVAKTVRQARELFRRLKRLIRDLGSGAPRITDRTNTSLEFANGSRVVVVASDADTVRGYSAVSLVVVDEAGFVGEDLFHSVSPMLAVSGGRLVALSTPNGKRGWLYTTWTQGDQEWGRILARSTECPRISAAFLERERRRLPALWFAQEYLAEFADSAAQCFSTDDIRRMFTHGVTPIRRALRVNLRIA